MAVRAQLFAGTYAQALRRADALDSGQEPPEAPHLDLTDVSPFDLEQLGEVAARVVRFGSGDLEISEIDLEHDLLFRLPPYLCDVLVELGSSDDPDAVQDAADEWAATEEMETGAGELRSVVTAVTELVAEAQEAGQDVYLWVESA